MQKLPFTRRGFLAGSAAAAGVVLSPAVLRAQGYPNRPVVIIVPSAPGGPADIVARLVSDRMSQALGQQVIVETAPGAGGTVGMGRVARAKPDGYTLLIHQTGFAIAPALHARLTFDTAKDFATVGLLTRSYGFFCGRRTLKADTFAELREWATGAGKPARVGHPGAGTFGHVQITMAMRLFAPEVNLIPYRGIAPAMNDLLGGHIDLAQVATSTALTHVQSGALKAYATSSPTRMPELPNVPSWAEVLSKDMARPLWHALFAPTGTPQPVLERLSTAVRETVADDKVAALYAKTGNHRFPDEMLSLEKSHAYVQEEIEFWGKVVRENNIKPV